MDRLNNDSKTPDQEPRKLKRMPNKIFKQTQQQSLCVFIVNWNRKRDLEILLTSLYNCLKTFKEQHPNYLIDILVLDNASDDGSVDMLEARHPNVNVIRNSVNLGGAGGFARGMTHAIEKGYSYLWILDNDAVLVHDALSPLIEVMNRTQNTGLVGSCILHKDNPDFISEAGAKIKWNSFPKPLCMNTPKTHYGHDDVFRADYVAACSALINVEAIRKCGPFDKDYFLMWDDMEWGFRISKYGFKVFSTVASQVIHPGFSERTPGVLLEYYAKRNHLRFINKNYRGVKRVLLLAYLNALIDARITKLSCTGRIDIKQALIFAKEDFWSGNFGKCEH
ncbi:MAG TPA: glycosyltransferase family 2 protein, partial [Candidatus Tenderia sp.]|nr:glycosyltransferase family 2 protein [Candidatus Tenderia sp.]